MQKLFLLALLIIAGCNGIVAQNCDLKMEDFTGASSANPPAGWIRGTGTAIQNTFDNDPRGVAVGFNNIGETMTSPSFTCAGEICFYQRSSGSTSNFTVELSIIQETYSDTTLLTTINFTGTSGQNQYHQVCFDIDSSLFIAPFDMRFLWEMTARSGGTYYFDDVCISSGTCVVQPTQFSFTSIPPGCIQTNTPTAIRVCAADANGFTADTYQDNISLQVNSGPGTISGTLSGNAVNGCFDALVSFASEGSYVLDATSSSGNGFLGTSTSISTMDMCPNEDTLTIMTYNLLNYPDGRDDCGPNTVVPDRWDTLAKIIQYVQPDILMVCELQNSDGADSILEYSLNVNGVTSYAAANYVPNQSTASTQFNNMMYYNADKLSLKGQDEVLTSTRDFNKYTVYGNDPGLAVSMDTVFLDLYMAHLKAGSASADSTRRATDCLTLRNYLDARPERNNILGGDLNFYTDQEQAYQTLISGTFPFVDPPNMEGAWDSNPSFATVLTQSSRGPGDPTYDCGFNGGTDSRFDFLLASGSIMNNTDNIEYLTGTYTPVGNNGSTYNLAINNPANTSGVPMSVLNAMYYMSDHLPVIMDVKMTYPTTAAPCGIVSNTNNSGTGSLRAVVECVSPGDTVFFDAAINNMTITLEDVTLLIGKSITLHAPGQNIKVWSNQTIVPSTLSISAGNAVTINGLEIGGSSDQEGVAIDNSGTLCLSDVCLKKGMGSSALSTVINRMTGQLVFNSSTSNLIE